MWGLFVRGLVMAWLGVGCGAAHADGDRPAPPPEVTARPAPAPRPIDGRVIATDPSDHAIGFSIGLPRTVDEGLVTTRWTGVFLADGQPIAGSGFALRQVTGHVVRAELAAPRLPSERVRLSPPRGAP